MFLWSLARIYHRYWDPGRRNRVILTVSLAVSWPFLIPYEGGAYDSSGWRVWHRVVERFSGFRSVQSPSSRAMRGVINESLSTKKGAMQYDRRGEDNRTPRFCLYASSIYGGPDYGADN